VVLILKATLSQVGLVMVNLTITSSVLNDPLNVNSSGGSSCKICDRIPLLYAIAERGAFFEN
jgi:hypothetical protein